MAFLIVGLVIISSCEQKDFPDYDPEQILQQEDEQGNYRAEFKSLNKKWTGAVRGYSILWARANQFYVRVSMQGLAKNVYHFQYIHEGAHCPDKYADSNQDGVIDQNEVIAASGKMLIPLDSDLSGQSEGHDGFPLSDEEGSYLYYRASSFRYLMSDLRSRDRNRRDQLTKLPAGGELRLHERIIVIYGSEDSPYLPIACAEIYEDFDPEE
jgi:hypothetical protein